MKIKIRQLKLNEVPDLKDFAPPDWSSDLAKFFSFHYEHNYFYPIVAEFSNKIVGCGCAIKNRTVGWLGNIIVLPEFRRQGIGEKITRKLMQFLEKHGYSIQLLIATKIGEPLYSKLGFKVTSNYHFWKIDETVLFEKSKNIRPLRNEDLKTILKLDKIITGEIRQTFIERFKSTGWVCTSDSSKRVEGYYLPDFGNGLIIANNNQSGLELMKFKLSQSQKIVIPEANITAINYLKYNGFEKYSVCPRMALNGDIEWKPELVFSRASGYCG